MRGLVTPHIGAVDCALALTRCGTFDYFAALGLTAYGAPPAAATAFALLTHLILWLPVTIAGMAALVLVRPAAGARLRGEPIPADSV